MLLNILKYEYMNMNMCHKKSLKIPNGYSEAVKGRRTNNTMGKMSFISCFSNVKSHHVVLEITGINIYILLNWKILHILEEFFILFCPRI
jgi:hypothetical protein